MERPCAGTTAVVSSSIVDETGGSLPGVTVATSSPSRSALRVRNGQKLQVRFEAYNLRNRANFGLPATTVFNASGRVDSASEITNTVGTSRQMQLGIRLEF